MAERLEESVIETERFLVGANLPWIRYGEFGANGWQPRGGLSQCGRRAEIAQTFEQVAASGVTALRWFLLCDGRAGIRFEDDGTPAGPDEALYRDVDAALELAGAAGLRIVPVLFDFLWCGARRIVNGVALGGRAAVWRSSRQREALVTRVVEPLLLRYGKEPLVLAWDLLNEPEWAVLGVGTWRPWRTLSIVEMRAWLGQLVSVVHEQARQPVTVGSASARWLWMVRGLGLDVYQVHWYDHLERRAPLATALRDAELDRPAWLGEMPTRGSRLPFEALLETARRAGYAGAFPWSVVASDAASDFAAAVPALERWTAAASVPPESPDTAGTLDSSGTRAAVTGAADAEGARS